MKTKIKPLLRTVLSVLVTFTVTSARAQNWVQWSSGVGGNNHYYALTLTASDWTTVQNVATSWDGYLATITSVQEQTFINNAFLIGEFERLPLWIGLTDAATEGTFAWVNGEALLYQNWEPGEPNDYPPGEDYAAINWHYAGGGGSKGTWNDTPHNGSSGFGGNTDGPYFAIVERDTPPPPPPSRCAYTYVQFGDHFYTLTHAASSWTVAEAEAISLGGHLVTINTLAEQEFLVSIYLSGANAASKSFWIGINDRASEGTFVWASGEPVTYLNWHSAEPNNLVNGYAVSGEDFGVINWHVPQQGTGTVGDWNDTPDAGINGALTGPLLLLGIIEVAQLPCPPCDTGIVWHQPLARNGASEDTDPSAGRTVKYRFNRGSTIPIQIHALDCAGADVTSNANVIGKVTVFGDSNCDGALDGNDAPIEFNGVGGGGGVMDKIGGHLKYNLDTKSLPTTMQCYILRVTVTDTSTGEEKFEEVLLQAK